MNEIIYDIVRSPVVTEKSTALSEYNKVVFKVAQDADKIAIKKAVEALFNVKVVSVNTLNVQGKIRRFRGVTGRRSGYKKAIVSLAEGQQIDVMAGI